MKLAGVMLLSIVLASPANAWQPLEIVDGQPLRWHAPIPCIADLDSLHLATVSERAVEAALVGAIKAWNRATCAGPVVLQRDADEVRCVEGGESDERCPKSMAAASIAPNPHDKPWPYGSHLLAVTLVEHRPQSATIDAARVVLNDAPHRFCSGTCGGAAVDLQATLSHELGHVLGLGHSAEHKATMYGKADAVLDDMASLDVDDIEGVRSLYGCVETPAKTMPWVSGAGEAAVGCTGVRTSALPWSSLVLLALPWMVWWRRTRRLSLLLVVMVATATASPAAHAWVQAKTAQGVAMRWHAAKIPYSIDEGALQSQGVGKEKMKSLVQSSFEAWQQVQCHLCHDPDGVACPPIACAAHPLGLESEFVGFQPQAVMGPGCVEGPGSSRQCVTKPAAADAAMVCTPVPNGNQVMFIEEAAKWCQSSLIVAVTLVAANQASGQIVDADVLVNAVDKQFCVEACGKLDYDLQNTVTHEFGHLLGLDHSTLFEATMFAGSPPQETIKRDLHADDIEGLCRLYRQAHDPAGCVRPEEPCCRAAPVAPGRFAPVTLAWLSMVVLLLVVRRRTAKSG